MIEQKTSNVHKNNVRGGEKWEGGGWGGVTPRKINSSGLCGGKGISYGISRVLLGCDICIQMYFAAGFSNIKNN